MGAPGTDSGPAPDPGIIYILQGPLTDEIADLADAEVKITGGNGGDKSGSSLSVGDLNNDQVDDLVVGAPTTNNPKTHTGTTYIFFGLGL